MASKYARSFSVPPGFPDVLRDLTRELLREYPREHEEQPKDQEWWLLDCASRYFGARTAMAGAAAQGTSMEDLEARIVAIFNQADTDNNGVLDHKEFRSVSLPLRRRPASTSRGPSRRTGRPARANAPNSSVCRVHGPLQRRPARLGVVAAERTASPPAAPRTNHRGGPSTHVPRRS